MKTPVSEGFRNRLTFGVAAAILYTSKQSAPAMTNQLYTMSIKGRKPIEFINALVSPMRCESSLRFVAEHQKNNKSKMSKCDLIPLQTAAKQDSKPNRGLQPLSATGFRQEQKLFLTTSKRSHIDTG